METQEKLRVVLDLLHEMKASDVVTIEAGDRTILMDYLVLATATSNTHAKAITNHVSVRLKELAAAADHIEADANWEWTILDLEDVVVHLFQERTRAFYNLEELWGIVQTIRNKEPLKKEPMTKTTRCR